MAPTWQELLNHRGLMAALTTWSWVAKLSNMHLERLLALIRKSAPQRCFLERLLATGHLTQILSRHRSAGGSDIRRITRKQLVQLVVHIVVQRVPFWRHIVNPAAPNGVGCEAVLGPGSAQGKGPIVGTNPRPKIGNRHSFKTFTPKLKTRGRHKRTGLRW